MNSHLISAAAGTGKTYQLALRFIALLVCGVPPERLIAVTFTRKAAGEFKNRILTLLASLSEEPADGRARDRRASDVRLIRQLINGTDAPQGLFPGIELEDALFEPERFAVLLKQVVSSLSRMNLSTNDSLFFKLNSTLSYELGVTGVSIMDEREKKQARLTALRSLGRSCMQNRDTSEVFQDMLDQASHSNTGDPEGNQLRQVEELHQLFLSAPDAAWGNAGAFGLGEGTVVPYYSRDEYTVVLLELIREADNDTYYYFLRSFDRVPETRKITILNSKGNPDNKSTIDDKLEAMGKKKQIPASHEERLERLIASAVACCWEKHIKEALVARRMLQEFDRHYHALVRGRGKYLFDDITRQLAGTHFNRDLQRTLRYRLFCRWDHWMLDEFQDTSHDQWNVLQPFLEDVYDSNEDGSLFFVGDPKQSIYGWRGGDPEIFNRVPDRFPGIITRDLTESYRSAQGVLDLANSIFLGTGRGRSIGYKEHTCAGPLKGRAGCAQILEAAESADKKQAVYDAVLSVMETVWKKGLSLAVLVRSNEEGRELATWLKSRGMPAEVNDDVMIGRDSPVMKNMLQFFTWLLHPGDRLNETLLLESPLWELLKKQSEPHPFSWAGWKKYIERNGYTALFDKVMSASGRLPEFQRNRLLAVMPYAAEADEKGMSLQDWVGYLSELRRRDNPPSGIVQIMTIHKSKGLGFDIVILPQVSAASPFADTRRRKYLVKRDAGSSPLGIIRDPGRIVTERTRELGPFLEEWNMEQRVEGYCQLYVALTRAKYATYAILQHGAADREKAPEKEGMFSILKETASACSGEEADRPSWEAAVCLYASGQSGWHDSFEARPVVQVADSKHEEQPLPPLRKIVRERPSEATHGIAGKPAAEPATEGGASFGTEVHAVFARITAWDDMRRPSWADTPSTAAEQVVLDCLAVPSIRALFEPGPGETVLNEQKVEDWQAGERTDVWTSGTIDRLVLGDGYAHIVDFKTDRLDSADELSARHWPQLERYRTIIAGATGIPLEKIRCSLVSTWLKQVIMLSQ